MFPTPWTVIVHVHSYGEENAYGERADVYTDRKEPVYGWAPPSAASEPHEQGRRAVIGQQDVYGPPGLSVSPLDEVTLPVGSAAGRYKVDGEVEDYAHGPFGFNPGVRIPLKRVREQG